MRWAAAYLATLAMLSAGIAWAVEIPADAWQWRRTLTREGQAAFGLNAPIADFGAQIHQESAWKPKAKSRVGAYGLSQFMPATATWISGAYPELGPDPQPANPMWALRALVTYDRHIWDRVRAVDGCHRMAKVLSGFNGGLSWVFRDEKLAASKGLDPSKWFGNVETVNSGRSAANFRENRQYPVRILIRLAPVYVRNDWGPTSCDDY